MISVWAELSYNMWINTLFNIFVQKDSPDEIYHYATDCCLRLPTSSNAHTCCGHPVLELRRGGEESLCFSSQFCITKQITKKKVLNPRLITKRKKILPSLYMRGFNHVAVCLPQLELVNGMLAEINELK